MPAKDRKPKWKPARERINPVAITLRFDDDDGDDAGAAFAFGDYLQHYRKGEMAEALERLAELHRLVGSLLMIHAAEANLYAGLTWEQIGQATGTTGQAAWQKWRYAPGTQDPIGTIRRRAQAGTRPRSGSNPESVVDRQSTRFQSGALGCLLALLGQRHGQRSTLLYLRLP